MRTNRDSLDIIADMLRVARKGASKTKIMYRANLSYMLLTKYLQLLLDKDFIHVNGLLYRTTNSGKEFLRDYMELSQDYRKSQKFMEELGNTRKNLKESFNINRA